MNGMGKHMEHQHTAELDLVREAAGHLTNIPGLTFTIEDHQRGLDRCDATLRLRVDGTPHEFAVEIKRGLTTQVLGAALRQLEGLPLKGMIVTDYMNPNMAERFRERDIPFIDAAGNAYINEPPLYIYVAGRKLAARPKTRRMPTRAFQPTGLKVIFALLCHPELVNAPYRDIAQTAQVALGTVGWVITDLKTMGHLVEMGKRGRRLVNKERLLARWVEAYPEQLRPKLTIGRYQAPAHDWWQRIALDNLNAYWGGEVAAAKLTQYLKPELVTIYTTTAPDVLLLQNKLRKAPDGDVELLKAFWADEPKWTEGDIAPPLVVYADLLATADPRNIETARIIYERELTRLIRED
jgi:hypothetical protein